MRKKKLDLSLSPLIFTPFITFALLLSAAYFNPSVFAAGSNDGLVTKSDGTTYLSTAIGASSAADTSNPDLALLPQGYAHNLTTLLTGVLSLLIAVVSLLVFVYLIWGGIEWITSGGDKAKTDQARSKIISALVGVIIIAASYAVLQIMLRFLGFGSLTEVFNNIVPISPSTSKL